MGKEGKGAMVELKRKEYREYKNYIVVCRPEVCQEETSQEKFLKARIFYFYPDSESWTFHKLDPPGRFKTEDEAIEFGFRYAFMKIDEMI